MTDKNNETGESGYYEPKSPAEKAFWKLHIIKKHTYPVKGGDEDMFTANNVKKAEQHKGDMQPGGKVPPPPKPGVVEAVDNAAKRAKKYKASCSMNEDSQAATADNPQQGTPAVDSGIPASSMSSGANEKQGNPVSDMLEKIAMQAAEIHDQLQDAGQVKDWVNSTLQEVKDGLDKVYEYLVNGTDQDDDGGDQAPVKTQTAESYFAEEGPVKRGRGRPKKVDDTGAGDAEGEHIIMQLRKVKSLKGGANKVQFKDGSSHKVPTTHAIKALSMHDSLKTAEQKDEFAKRLHHSHDEFHDAISGKPPKPPMDLYAKIVARRKAAK